MKNLIARFVREDAGQDLMEYVLVATFVSLAVVAGATTLAGSVNGWYSQTVAQINGMNPVAAPEARGVRTHD